MRFRGKSLTHVCNGKCGGLKIGQMHPESTTDRKDGEVPSADARSEPCHEIELSIPGMTLRAAMRAVVGEILCENRCAARISLCLGKVSWCHGTRCSTGNRTGNRQCRDTGVEQHSVQHCAQHWMQHYARRLCGAIVLSIGGRVKRPWS